MVGREIADNYYRADKESCKDPEIVLSAKDVTAGKLDNISFSLHKGEILGFGGLADCGMHDIGRIAFGLLPLTAGEVKDAHGQKIEAPAQAMSEKIGYIAKIGTRKHL